MPLARIFTLSNDNPSELTQRLTALGFEVEVVGPGHSVSSRPADLEIRLEECSPGQALSHAGALLNRRGLSDDAIPPAEPTALSTSSASIEAPEAGSDSQYYVYEDAVLLRVPSCLKPATWKACLVGLYSRLPRVPKLRLQFPTVRLHRPRIPSLNWRLPRPEIARLQWPRIRVPRVQVPSVNVAKAAKKWTSAMRFRIPEIHPRARVSDLMARSSVVVGKVRAQLRQLARLISAACASVHGSARTYIAGRVLLRRPKSAKISPRQVLPSMSLSPVESPSPHSPWLRRPPTRQSFWDSALAVAILAVCALFTGSLLQRHSPLPPEIAKPVTEPQPVPFSHTAAPGALKVSHLTPATARDAANATNSTAATEDSSPPADTGTLPATLASTVAKHVHRANLSTKVFPGNGPDDEVVIHYFQKPIAAPTTIASDGVKHYTDLH